MWDKIINMGLDVVLFPGRHFASHIGIAAKLRVDSHTSEDCVHVHSTTDGGADIKKASLILTGDLDIIQSLDMTVTELLDGLLDMGSASLCMAHGEHLLIMNVLGSKGQLGSATVISRDIRFIHNMAVYFETYSGELDLLFEILAQLNIGQLKVLGIDCDTRWNDRYLAVERFLRLRLGLERWYVHPRCRYSISNDSTAPEDALTDAFWLRLTGTERLLGQFQKWSSEFQTENTVVASFLPRAVHSLQSACVFIEGRVGVVPDAAAVQELKTGLLNGIDKYLAYPLKRVSAPLKAALLDPNESNVAAYGVEREVIDATWAALKEDVEVFTPALVQYFDNTVGGFRNELESISKKVQSGQIQHVNPLDFYQAKRSQDVTKGLEGALFSDTARALFTLQLSSAASERRIKAVKRILTSERNALDSMTVEDLFVIRDWLKDGPFTKAKFDELIEAIQEVCANDPEMMVKLISK
jgi:hypothetical protein